MRGSRVNVPSAVAATVAAEQDGSSCPTALDAWASGMQGQMWPGGLGGKGTSVTQTHDMQRGVVQEVLVSVLHLEYMRASCWT